MSHSHVSPFISKDCRYPGCRKAPRIKGLCKGHYASTKNKTTNGVKTGGKPKLTESQVKEVMKLRSSFKTQREIAIMFGVSLTVIKKVFDKTYVPAPDPEPVS